jgi:hypothetical protein
MASGSRVNGVPKPSVVHASLSLRSEPPLGDMTRHMAAAPDVLAALFDVRTGRIIVYHRPKPLAHSYHEAGAPKIVSSRQARGNDSHPDHVFFSFFAWLGAQARYANGGYHGDTRGATPKGGRALPKATTGRMINHASSRAPFAVPFVSSLRRYYARTSCCFCMPLGFSRLT